MKCYSVAPDKDASRWIVKLEDVAPDETYTSKEGALEAAERMAMVNKPSKVEILNEDHQVVGEIIY